MLKQNNLFEGVDHEAYAYSAPVTIPELSYEIAAVDLVVRETKDVDALGKSFREANAHRRIARHIVGRLGETEEVEGRFGPSNHVD